VAIAAFALEAHGLWKQYGRTTALRDVSLGVPWQSVTGLVGPNGAGKTTLMKAWVGFLRPNAGRVRVAGFDPIRRRADVVARVAYVAQRPMLYREVRVADHLHLAARWRGWFDHDRARRWLAAFGIDPDRPVGTLSGGQQAQVSLAVALGTGAPILILDEALSHLDPLARHDFLHVLRSAVAEDGRTAVLSSHVVADLEQVCDRIVVLGLGTKLLDAPLAELRQGYRIVPGWDAAGPGEEPVGPLPQGGGFVVRLAAGHPETSPAGLASVEQVVLAYLGSQRAQVQGVGVSSVLPK
jgi:ABC-2 type transport system ATP-binding protein